MTTENKKEIENEIACIRESLEKCKCESAMLDCEIKELQHRMKMHDCRSRELECRSKSLEERLTRLLAVKES